MKTEKDRDEMLKEITAIDFTIIDLHLYLNTHPMDKEAIIKYNSAVAKSQELRRNYEKLYGMLSPRSCSPYPWQWIAEPWPWEYDANFKLDREER